MPALPEMSYNKEKTNNIFVISYCTCINNNLKCPSDFYKTGYEIGPSSVYFNTSPQINVDIMASDYYSIPSLNLYCSNNA